MEWHADIDDARHFPKINSVDLEELEISQAVRLTNENESIYDFFTSKDALR